MREDDVGGKAIAAHDRQRELPAEARRALIAGLGARLRGRGWCLDAGVGTGSVALPLAEAGFPLVGVDLSRAMLAALRGKAGGAPFPLVRGDLLRLPFREASFGAALAAHVFHLISDWRTAVDEIVRVVAPGGLLLVNLGSGGQDSEGGALVQAAFRERLGAAWPMGDWPFGPRSVDDFDSRVLGLGAASMAPLAIRFEETTTIEEAIARLEHNVFARPNGIDPDALRRAAAETRVWARERLGPLDVPRPRERQITYRIYRLPERVARPRPETRDAAPLR